MEKKKLMIDMDGVLADFAGAIKRGGDEKNLGFFTNLTPLPHAVESVKKLAQVYDVFILSTPSWSNPHSWTEKRLWVEKHFGDLLKKKVMLTHRKDLIRGDILIDDHTWNGADRFQGELILFGSEQYPDWNVVLNYLMETADESRMLNRLDLSGGRMPREPHLKGKGLGALFSEDDIKKASNGHSNNGHSPKTSNTMETKTAEKEKDYAQLVQETKDAIRVELDLCQESDTPTVCAMKADGEGYSKLEAMILTHVADGGLSISQAIIEVERSYNPNMIQD